MNELKEGADIGDGLTRVATGDAVAFLRSIGTQLKDGGILKLRIPDFDGVIAAYEAGSEDIEAQLIPNSDQSGIKSIWNREKLSRLLNLSGFEIMSGAEGWAWNDSRTTISVVARKYLRPNPEGRMKEIHAVMSLPRVCWTDTQGVLHQAAAALGFDVSRATGVFWGQCLERLMKTYLKKPNIKYILTVDYDSIFDPDDIVRLWQVMETNPDIAALCPLQIGRDKEMPLFSIKDDSGRLMKSFSEDRLYTDALDMNTGHFGLTLIRCDAIRDLPSPLFWGQPNANGEWDDGRIDDDIHFWNRLREANLRICLCPRVRIGHLQNVVTWPGEDLKAIQQYLTDYHDNGRPKQCMTF